MQEKLTTEIFEQIDCIKVHLRNLQTVAEIEKMLPVSCDELHKGIAEMEKSLVHLMNFEKMLKAKVESKKDEGLTINQKAVIIALTNAAELSEKVFIRFNETFLQGVGESYPGLYCILSRQSCHVFKRDGIFGLVYGKEIVHFSSKDIVDIVVKVEPALV